MLENRYLCLTVEPAAGGKITSLEDVRTGRQWLWKNPYLEQMPQPYGASYVESLDTGGWDEIFPSVLPCQVGLRVIPDHGDLVSLPWEVLDASPFHLEMAVTTRFAPCRFTRRLRLEEGTLRVEYRLKNFGHENISYLWCAHPLIAIEPGMTIALPAGTPMRVDVGVGIPAGTTFSWPHAPGLPAFDTIPDIYDAQAFKPFAAKLFSAAGSANKVTLTTADGREALQVAWDVSHAPFLGLWLNCGAWSGFASAAYFNLGIEPATAPFDSLNDAILDGSGHVLGPGETHAWSLELTVFARC